MQDARDLLQELQPMSPAEQEAHLHRRMNDLVENARAESLADRISGSKAEDRKGFVVTQEREVKIAAQTPTDAVRLASALFSAPHGELNPHVKETSISAREEY